MYAVVSLLDETSRHAVEAIWDEFQTEFGVHGVSRTPLPHLSYHVARKYDMSDLQEQLSFLLQQITSFTIHSYGLGLFTGPQPVLYLAVAVEPELSNMQRRMWQVSNRYAHDTDDHYHPSVWRAHVTLAHQDMDHDMLARAVRLLSERDFNWEMRVDNIAIVGGDPEDSGKPHEVVTLFPFSR